jgi:MFS family permease
MIPVALFMLPKEIVPRNKLSNKNELKSDWRQRDVLKSKQFSILAPSVLLMPFASTGLFFYQLSLAEFKGWTAEWIALCFIGFAIASSSSMIIAGYLTDRFKAKNIFPFFYLPFLVGLVFLLLFTSKWIALVYMTMMGISVGMGKVVKSALQAELFGINSLGAVRSLFSTLMVFSTALSPALFGFLLDKGIDFNQIILGIIIVTFLVIVLSVC